MTGGDGRARVLWVIMRVEETQRVFEADGRPRRVEFRLQLALYGEDENQRAQQILFGGG